MSRKPLGAVPAVVFGGLTVATLDILDAFVFWGVRGVSPVRILQSIASGLLGRASYGYGARSAALGAVCHLFIATTVVLVCVVASRRVTVLRERPWQLGPVYGILVWMVMNFIVLPLSAAGPPHFTALTVANGLFAHVCFVGTPSTLFARAAWRGGS